MMTICKYCRLRIHCKLYYYSKRGVFHVKSIITLALPGVNYIIPLTSVP